jgi:NAD-dependent dihydropyrimidine dehydrogenase PreA subunit
MSGSWFPVIYDDKCDGCVKIGKPRCVEYCQNGVFAFQNGKAVVAHPEKCVNGCVACENVCHAKAISFPQQTRPFKPVVSEDKGLLHKTVCIKCGKTFWTNRDIDICIDCEDKKL